MDGLVTMTPSSIDHVGTSASINANGGVDFEGVTSLSLNGVFTGNHDNYLVMLNVVATVDGSGVRFYLRASASGSDATGSDYADQSLVADNTPPYGHRYESQTSGRITLTGTTEAGCYWHIYGPYLAQPTATRSTTASSSKTATISDYAATHSLSTSYDGFTLFNGTLTGNLIVMGYAE